jgi:hypothetical protein
MFKTLKADVPPVVWAAAIVFLFLLSQWMTTYFGAVGWVKALAGLLATVLVPTLRLIGQGEEPAGRLMDGTPTPSPKSSSRLYRWLF